MSPVFSQGVLFVVILILALFVPVYFILRRRGRTQAEPARTPGEKARRALVYVLRLLGFALLALLLVAGGTTVFLSYQGAQEDMRPAPSEVEVPPDLPFTVEEVAFPGGDGLTLRGWYVPSQNGATVILLHGYGGNRTQMIWHATVLTEAGYGVLLYDERASGESDGERRSYGWEDPADVAGALAYLNGLPATDPARIGIAGCSIGGQIALQGAAYSPQVAAVWADGPAIITTRDMTIPRNWVYPLAMSSNHLVDWFTARALDRDVPPAMIEIIARIEPRPVLLVAGGAEKPLVGSESLHVANYAAHAGPHTELWVIPEAIHCDGPAVRPEEYAGRLVAFFDAALGIAR